MSKKFLHEEFVKLINEISPNINILGEYKGSQKKILVSCKFHPNYLWSSYGNNLLGGYGCKYCAAANKITCQPQSQESFEKKLNLIYPDIMVLGKYINSSTKILVRCNKDGYEWSPFPKDLLSKKGCPKCSNVYRRTHEEFMREVSLLHPNISVSGIFKRLTTKMNCVCMIDGYEWKAIAGSLLSGKGCIKCAKRLKKTQEDFVKEMAKKYPDILVTGIYKNAKEKISFQCKKCECLWDDSPFNFLYKNYRGCPKCDSRIFSSENRAKNFFIKLGIEYSQWVSFDNLFGCGGRKLSFDFAIYFNKKIFSLIEIDGIFHYQKIFENQSLENQIKNDSIKNEYCFLNNITLVRIPYWEFENMEKILEMELSPLLERR